MIDKVIGLRGQIERPRKKNLDRVICGLWCTLASIVLMPSAIAQPIPDATLGLESSSINPNAVLNGIPIIQIESGAVRGENLFHSFESFNIESGQSVYFANPADVSRIFSRVTGDSAASIFGTLGVNGAADLFLLSPNGIVFGPDAILDTQGSFVANTAEQLLFTDGVAFGVQPAAGPPLLTFSVPTGLQYGASPGGISLQGNGNNLQLVGSEGVSRVFRNSLAIAFPPGSPAGIPAGLQIQPNQTLALVGGDITLTGGNITVVNGRLELGSVAAGSVVGLLPVPSGWALDYSAVENFQDIQLTQAALAETLGRSDIQVVGQNLDLFEGAAIVADRSGDGMGGRFDIQTAESVRLNGTSNSNGFSSGLYAQSGATSTGTTASPLTISTRQLQLEDSGQINVGNFGTGTGRSLIVTALDTIQLSNQREGGIGSALLSETTNGDAGDLILNTGSLSVLNSSVVSSSTYGPGRGGNLRINASDTVTLNGRSSNISTISGPRDFNRINNTGDAGDLEISTARLFVQDDAFISSESRFGSGAGGRLAITATDSVQVTGSSTLSSSTFNLGQAAGDLTIQTPLLDLQTESRIIALTGNESAGGAVIINADQIIVGSASRISANTFGGGPGGNIDIQAQQIELLDRGASISSNTTGSGAGGNVAIQAQQIELLANSALISADSSGSGDGGNVVITGVDQLALGAFTRISAATSGRGAGGNVDIQARQIQLQSLFGNISTNTTGSGAGGDINIQAQQIELQTEAVISANTRGRGAGGDINIQTQLLQVLGGANISASTSDEGDGGNVDIRAQRVEVIGPAPENFLGFRSGLFTNGNFRASQSPGRAGNLTIVSDTIFLDNNGRITADTGAGNGGNIALQANDVLLLRNGSLISATAGNDMAGGDGGNVRVDANFIVALPEENSDITANAFEGRGGNVSINSQGVLGIEFRENLTPLSDITASSEFGQDGVVNIETPETVTAVEEIQLPTDFEDASDRIGESLCSGEGNAFTASGRGGLPSTPYGALSGAVTWEDWYILEAADAPSEMTDPENISVENTLNNISVSDSDSGAIASTATPPIPEPAAAIVEAQGWQKDSLGDVVLMAPATTPLTGELHNGLRCRT